MKYKNRIIAIFIMVLLISSSTIIEANANSAEPPNFTVIVVNAPNQLSLSLQFPGEKENSGILLKKEEKAWESYYRFFYNMLPNRDFKLEDAELIVKSQEKTFKCQIPSESFDYYNNILTLDMETESLDIGQPWFRTPLLVAMRVIFTLLIEGIIFFLFRYRQKRSWVLFFAINIITQGGLNLMLTGPSLGSYWIFGYFFGEIIVIALEVVLFTWLLKESKKTKAFLFIIVANIISLVLGGMIISYLPI